ncbi:MAG TPA: hypothetical protein VD931_09405, partial [Baekduia sp.]|nr:hypothetical protein [Baekduia sp.]
MSTYFRVQPASRPLEALVGAHHISRLWVGDATVRCPRCRGDGMVNGDEGELPCPQCDGRGEYDDVRRGVSVCRSIEDLRRYFRSRSPNLDGDHIVELEGEVSEDEDYDAGRPGDPLLVHPTRIVAIHPV